MGRRPFLFGKHLGFDQSECTLLHKVSSIVRFNELLKVRRCRASPLDSSVAIVSVIYGGRLYVLIFLSWSDY